MKKARIALLLVLLTALLTGCGNKDYEKANDYFQSGNYDVAARLYGQLGDYKDSAALYLEAEYQYGLSKMDDEYSRDRALKSFQKVGEYKDAPALYDECALREMVDYVPLSGMDGPLKAYLAEHQGTEKAERALDLVEEKIEGAKTESDVLIYSAYIAAYRPLPTDRAESYYTRCQAKYQSTLESGRLPDWANLSESDRMFQALGDYKDAVALHARYENLVRPPFLRVDGDASLPDPRGQQAQPRTCYAIEAVQPEGETWSCLQDFLIGLKRATAGDITFTDDPQQADLFLLSKVRLNDLGVTRYSSTGAVTLRRFSSDVELTLTDASGNALFTQRIHSVEPAPESVTLGDKEWLADDYYGPTSDVIEQVCADVAQILASQDEPSA